MKLEVPALIRGNALSVIILSNLLLISAVNAQNDRKDTAMSPPRVEIPGTQLLTLTSSIVGQEYDLYVHLPRFYEDSTRTFPVVYLLDAQWDFPLVAAIWGEQYYDGFIPGLIIVGITWGGENPNHDALRARDLTPSNIQQMPQSGNAPKFLAFIKDELIPFIASKYRTNADRTLMGSSFGGLFTLYSLFQEPDLFNRYVLTSPALAWDREMIYGHEDNFGQKESKLPARVFMAVGDLEAVSSFRKFADRLKARNYEGMMLETRVLENTGHSGTKAEGYTRGLQFVFQRPSLSLARETLQPYAGVYELNQDIRIQIKLQDGHLVLQAPDDSRIILRAETETDFYMKGSYFFVRFKKDPSGQYSGMELERFTGTDFFKRVN